MDQCHHFYFGHLINKDRIHHHEKKNCNAQQHTYLSPLWCIYFLSFHYFSSTILLSSKLSKSHTKLFTRFTKLLLLCSFFYSLTIHFTIHYCTQTSMHETLKDRLTKLKWIGKKKTSVTWIEMKYLLFFSSLRSVLVVALLSRGVHQPF